MDEIEIPPGHRQVTCGDIKRGDLYWNNDVEPARWESADFDEGKPIGAFKFTVFRPI